MVRRTEKCREYGETYTGLALQLVGGKVVADELLVEAGLVLTELDGSGPEAGAIRGPITSR
jgi:hypothetical protein